MYIQITTRCNMKCRHCCYACTEKGEDMSLAVFKKALEYDNEAISIGGGEPTIHPQFWEFIGLALGYSEYVWLATNGKETDTALALARMAKRGVLACELSQDKYHSKIDKKVVAAFTKENKRGEYISNYQDSDLRGIRDITSLGREPIKAGRCKDGSQGCVCEDLLV